MIDITEQQFSETLTHEGVAMVEINISYPSVKCDYPRAAKRITAFYTHQVKALTRYARKSILPAATAEYISALKTSAVFRPLTVTASYEVTVSDGYILSLFRDIAVRVGNTVRTHTRHGDTWSVSTGWFLELASFFPRGENFRRLLTKNAAAAASGLIRAGTHRFHGDCAKLIRRKFSRDSFYIVDSGIAIFYARGDIAPESEGTPVFVYRAERTAATDELSA